MRRIIASEFLSLDGVMESPEQWHFPYWNDEMGQKIMAAMGQADAMLMGRVNYEEWAAFWPQQKPADDSVTGFMNGVRKYVVSTTLKEPLAWNNSTLIAGNVVEEIAGLKRQAGGDVSISGSGTLVRSLLKDGLLDELRLMVHPVVVRKREASFRRRAGSHAPGACGVQDLLHRCRLPHLPAGKRPGRQRAGGHRMSTKAIAVTFPTPPGMDG